jgi:hypothetical protein
MSRPLQDAPQAGEPFLLTQKKFFIVVSLLLAVVIVRAVPIRMSVAKREAGQARMRMEVPSMENLRVIQPVSVDEALLNTPIAGYTPHESSSRPQIFLQPPGMDYAVTYYPEYDIPRPYQNSISVSVQQCPNPQWASYLAEFPRNMYNPYDNPKVHAIVTQFQNKVRTNSLDLPAGTVGLYYMWPSGNNVVTLTYYTLDQKEDFLRLYLQKYPSSVQ